MFMALGLVMHCRALVSCRLWELAVDDITLSCCSFSTRCIKEETASCRASVSCSLWELAVEDILRMRVLQPTIIDDLAAHFVRVAERSLATMDPATL